MFRHRHQKCIYSVTYTHRHMHVCIHVKTHFVHVQMISREEADSAGIWSNVDVEEIDRLEKARLEARAKLNRYVCM